MNTQISFPGFYANMLLQNNLMEKDFIEFVFYKGMLFNEISKWWGPGGFRPTAHEGIDLLYYTDFSGTIKKFPAGTKVPSVGCGRVAAVINDILGQSIFLEHDFMKGDLRLYSAYAHIEPDGKIHAGRKIDRGEIIARIIGFSEKKHTLLPHLHLSLAWIPPGLFPDRISWKIMGDRETVELIDPLPMLGLPCRIFNYMQPAVYGYTIKGAD